MTDITTNRVSTDRLNQIARAIADGDYRELTMRIPAEPDRDADLVISAAADEIDRLRAEVAEWREPSPEECERIFREYLDFGIRSGFSDTLANGRAMFDAVRAVMRQKGGV